MDKIIEAYHGHPPVSNAPLNSRAIPRAIPRISTVDCPFRVCSRESTCRTWMRQSFTALWTRTARMSSPLASESAETSVASD
jgi:hypothetical protein